MVDIVDSSDLWVIANYRETQLSNIREGADVEMTADAVPGVTFKGIVESISDATGAAFSMIPAGQCNRELCKGRTTNPRPHQPERKQAGRFKTLACRFQCRM